MVKGIISYLNSNKRSKMSEGKPMDLTDKYRYDKNGGRGKQQDARRGGSPRAAHNRPLHR